MSKHKGLPCQHTFNKGHKHATLFLLFFFAYAHAKRVRQVSCERVRTVPCACNHLIHCFPVEGHNCQSTKHKITDIAPVIDQHRTNIIFGTESWLNFNITSIKIFPNVTLHGKTVNKVNARARHVSTLKQKERDSTR